MKQRQKYHLCCEETRAQHFYCVVNCMAKFLCSATLPLSLYPVAVASRPITFLARTYLFHYPIPWYFPCTCTVPETSNFFCVCLVDDNAEPVLLSNALHTPYHSSTIGSKWQWHIVRAQNMRTFDNVMLIALPENSVLVHIPWRAYSNLANSVTRRIHKSQPLTIILKRERT